MTAGPPDTLGVEVVPADADTEVVDVWPPSRRAPSLKTGPAGTPATGSGRALTLVAGPPSLGLDDITWLAAQSASGLVVPNAKPVF